MCGVCRDVNKAIADDYPMFSRGRFMRTGKDRVQVDGINVAVSIAQTRVCARDIVVADANGVVVVPSDRAGEVAAATRKIEEIEEIEDRIRKELAQGKTLQQARAALGYHTLQRKSS